MISYLTTVIWLHTFTNIEVNSNFKREKFHDDLSDMHDCFRLVPVEGFPENLRYAEDKENGL